MRLKKLLIERVLWGENVGQLNGEVEFDQSHGSIKLRLGEKMSYEILALCSQAIKDSANEVASALLEEVQLSFMPVDVVQAVENATCAKALQPALEVGEF